MLQTINNACCRSIEWLLAKAYLLILIPPLIDVTFSHSDCLGISALKWPLTMLYSMALWEATFTSFTVLKTLPRAVLPHDHGSSSSRLLSSFTLCSQMDSM